MAQNNFRDEYQKTQENIHLSEDARASILTEAEKINHNVEEQVPSTDTTKRSPRRFRPRIRSLGIAAAACFILFTLLLVVNPNPFSSTDATHKGGSFSIEAYASQAENILLESTDGMIVFNGLGTGSAGEDGSYTGCLFSIEGKNIERVEVGLSKGQIYANAEEEYRMKNVFTGDEDEKYIESNTPEGTGLTFATPEEKTLADEENRMIWENVRKRLAKRLGGRYDDMIGSSSDMSHFLESASRLLGSSANLPYDGETDEINLSRVKLGFYVNPEDMIIEQPDEFGDRWPNWEESLDSFDGEHLYIKVFYKDGTEESKTFTLRTGYLKTEFDKETQSTTILPELADITTGCYTIYCTEEN